MYSSRSFRLSLFFMDSQDARSNAAVSSTPRVDYLDRTKGRLRPMEQRRAGKFPGVVLFGAVGGVLLLGYSLDRQIGGHWIVSAVTAIAIAAILAANAFLLIGEWK